MVYMYMQCMQWYTCGLVFLTSVRISTLTSGFSFSMDVVMESSMKFSVDVVISVVQHHLLMNMVLLCKYFKGSLSPCQSV